MDTKKRTINRFWAAAALVAFLAAGAAPALAQKVGDTVYAKVPNARVRKSEAATSELVAELDRGAPMKVLEISGTRVKVAFDGKQGFISRLHVTDVKPKTGGGGVLDDLARSDVSADERQTVASLRGLSPAAKTYAQNAQLTEQSVKWAEQMEKDSEKITPTEVDHFLRAENIGL